MRTITTATRVQAPPSAVWTILTDLPGYSRWNPFIQHAAGRLHPGERLTLRLHPTGRRPVTFRPRVLVARPHSELRWIGRLLVPGLFDGEHSFTLRPAPGNTTDLVHAERFSGLLVPLFGSSLTAVEREFESMNRALRKTAEPSA
ncbi:SRPBCC domain-containing protein [Streptomyces coacervatus]|uniref:SRPBCC domain-containing protein n=1 Tax=Streptomyces coacervatus TaxID=647381 RepID=A0ABP7IQX0_9ACTN|nr:SRPBCC domain-containing protein [Streptomyces coacervatus]MDF2266835.1 SRPBCC domain-containing protein [Streptomyces coacervatus]